MPDLCGRPVYEDHFCGKHEWGKPEDCNCWSDGEPDKGCALCGGKGTVVECGVCGAGEVKAKDKEIGR